MKDLLRCIGFLLALALLTACGGREEGTDSSALKGTPSWTGTACRNLEKIDSLNEFDGHYCQLLVSELLFKNDYAQSNREALLQAVGYFDSLLQGDGGHGNGVHIVFTDGIAFLDARAHYQVYKSLLQR